MQTMLILPGIASSGGLHDSRGLLDRKSALEYARRRGYVGRVLDIPGDAYAGSPQAQAATRAIRNDTSITALYGFSGGGYNVRHVIENLTRAERGRLKLVVILGAPRNPKSLYAGPWELVYRTDPFAGHMAGPKALLAELGPETVGKPAVSKNEAGAAGAVVVGALSVAKWFGAHWFEAALIGIAAGIFIAAAIHIWRKKTEG